MQVQEKMSSTANQTSNLHYTIECLIFSRQVPMKRFYLRTLQAKQEKC